MYLRINGLEITPDTGYAIRGDVSFGKAGDPARAFAATIRCYGSSDSNARSLATALQTELCRDEVTVVARRSASDAADAVSFTAEGAQPWETPVTILSEARNVIDVVISLAIGSPWLTPANRVFLASPIGDEFPDSDDVVRACVGAGVAEQYVYADGGRYCVRADASDRGDLRLHFDCVDDEFLPIEFDYDLVDNTGSIYLMVLAVLPSGATTYVRQCLYTPTVGRGRYIGAVRIPTSTAKRGYLRIVPSGAAALEGYIWNVQVGHKSVAHDRILPRSPSALSPGTSPYGWTPETQTGVTWTYDSSNRFILTAAAASAACCLAYGTEGVAYATHAAVGTDGMLPVKPGRTIGWQATFAVTAYTSGTAAVECAWYDSDGAYLSASTLLSKTATYSSATSYGELTVPDRAAFASILLGCTSGATLTAQLSNVDLGEHIQEAPGTIRLNRIEGDAPARLHVISDTDIESAAHLVCLAVQRDDGQSYVIESEALYTTKGGATVWGTGSTDAKAHGGHLRLWATASWLGGYGGVSRLAPGTYRVFGKAFVTSGGSGYITLAELGDTAQVAVTSAVPLYHDMGLITLPIQRSIPGTENYLGFGMNNTAATGMGTDVFVLVREPAVVYHDSTAAYGATSFEVDERGDVYIDGGVHEDVVPVVLEATGRDVLFCLADRTNADYEPTHLMRHEVYAVEQYALWKG